MKYLNIKKLLICLLLLLAVIMPTNVWAEEPGGENPGGEPPAAPPTITNITINPSVVEDLQVTQSKQLELIIEYSDGTKSNTPKEGETILWNQVEEKDFVSIDENGKITGQKPGQTSIVAKVKDHEEIKASCLITVIEKQKSSDASIKNLEVTSGKLNPVFNSNTTEYTYTISSTIKLTKDLFKITPVDGAKIFNIDIPEKTINNAKVTITIQAEDGKETKSYTLMIQKQKANLNLQSLGIKGYTLKETFSPETIVYSATIPFDATDVTIEAETMDPNAKISIKGATNLNVGENVINVVVSDADGNSNTYKVVVTREEEEERVETGNSVKYSNPSQTIKKSNTDIGVKTHNTLRYIFITLGCIVLFSIGVVGIYFFKITSKKQLKKAKIEALKIERNQKQKELVNETAGIYKKETKIEEIDIMEEFNNNSNSNNKDE